MGRVEGSVGVDVGGTFTDFVILDPEGRLTVQKRASTPNDPSEGLIAGLRAARETGGIRPGFALAHGTTVATNALLERRGARTALLTTAGFRDVLEIGRQARDHLYTFHPTKPIPLLARDRRYELTERVDWLGEVLTPLKERDAEELLDRLRHEGIESVAVCFLFAYLNPAHEQLVGTLARKRGFCVSLSSEVAPEPREYERTSTTVANAYVAPIMARYLGRLSERLGEVEAGRLRVMQSDGGALSAHEASERAIRTALSGPAAGVVAAARCGAQAGLSDLLTFDMGGTSTDVALIQGGHCPVTTSAMLAGMPLRTPMLSIHTVGAGGGSLAYRDAGGGLRVGPQSAGADPGPVAYGRGDTLTVTDANLLLGRLPARIRLAGHLPLDNERVRAHFAPFSRSLGLTPEAAALGIVTVANASMAHALRHISVERGVDPCDFTLLSFGGAGGLHACALAEALGMRSVLVPRWPGAFSALGLLLADVRREIIHALPMSGTQDWAAPEVQERFRARFSVLEAQAAREMAREGFGEARWHGERLLDLRYVGQSSELRIPMAGQDDLTATIETFHRAHRARYGHADSREPVEAVAARVVALVPTDTFTLHTEMPEGEGALPEETEVYCSSGWTRAALYTRDRIGKNHPLVGPAIVVQEDATTFVEPGWRARHDDMGNLRLFRDG